MAPIKYYVLSALGAALLSADATAQSQCRVVEFEMTPSDDLQIVIWLEDEAGNFVDTAFITQGTGSFGIGNRPGMLTFNSGPGWPYGRRESVFPIWAHRHGLTWPKIVFQDEKESDLSHALNQSSPESYFCRPIRPEEALWDAATCATTVHTDKGKLSSGETSLYPPRSDLRTAQPQDDPSVGTMAGLNPFDAVSRATPLGGALASMAWSVPKDLAPGEYVAWIEVSKSFDLNEEYRYPSPIGIPWSDYGEAYRGQPSVVYQIPFSLPDDGVHEASTAEYAGYGDPDGVDGQIRPPDRSITSGVAGSGAGRLLLTMDESGADMYRAQVRAKNLADSNPPDAITDLVNTLIGHDSATLEFIAPADDTMGKVTGYEVRYSAEFELNSDNFSQGVLAELSGAPLEPGQLESIQVQGLMPNTYYWLGVRPFDDCLNYGETQFIQVKTQRPETGSVDACFVATAAYGSLMANQVQDLRHFRDSVLRKTVLGEIFVETYYSAGPALATWVGITDSTREVARTFLQPLVNWVQRVKPRN